jgi:hypothetical protein
MNRILPLLLFAPLAAAQWPTPKSAMEAYDFVQDRRSAAEKLWEKKDPAGIDMLLATAPYLDQPLVRDLAQGNKYLAARQLNIDMDLAQAYLLQGDKRKSLEYLRRVATETMVFPWQITTSIRMPSNRYATILNSAGFCPKCAVTIRCGIHLR